MKLFCWALLLGLVALALGGCKKENRPELELLPPATLTGANTFGCLVNGKAWTPNGSEGNPSGNLIVVYDRSLNRGALQLRTFRYTDPGDPVTYQGIAFFTDYLTQAGTYVLSSPPPQVGVSYTSVYFNDRRTNCFSSSLESNVYRKGSITITLLDRTRNIIAGTFDFTLYKPGCDTIKVTNGRFDVKQ